MTILAMQPRRSRDGARASVAARRRASCLVLAGVLIGFSGVIPAQAQSGAAQRDVEVDLGALDAISPPPPGAPPSRIRLHMPESSSKPPVVKKQVSRQSAPASPQQAAASAPATQQAETSAPPAPAKAAKTAKTAMTEPPASAGQARVAPPPPNLPPPPTGANATPTATPQDTKPNATVATIGPVADQILFPADGIKLPDDAKAELDDLAKRLSADGHLYVQLVGYAGGETDSSQARRISLSRALAARSYLVDQGVQIKQVDVRPLGNKSDPGLPPDRVDLVVAER
jgi:outer membrane protein OmpA-like peptidoglycan-associated protein